MTTQELEIKINESMFMNGGNTDAEKYHYSCGATFGYSLAEKEIERLKGLIEDYWKIKQQRDELLYMSAFTEFGAKQYLDNWGKEKKRPNL